MSRREILIRIETDDDSLNFDQLVALFAMQPADGPQTTIEVVENTETNEISHTELLKRLETWVNGRRVAKGSRTRLVRFLGINKKILFDGGLLHPEVLDIFKTYEDRARAIGMLHDFTERTNRNKIAWWSGLGSDSYAILRDLVLSFYDRGTNS